MTPQIRIREIRDQGSPSLFKNIDLGGDKGRGDAPCSIFRDLGHGRQECITFIPDTLHNRAQVLNKRVEVAAQNAAGGWTYVNPATLDDLFAPCQDGVELPGDPRFEKTPVQVAAEKPSMGINGYLRLPKAEQIRIVGELPKEALVEILACNDDRLAPKVKGDAQKRLDKLTAVDVVEPMPISTGLGAIEKSHKPK